MAHCFGGAVTPFVAPFEQRNQVCIDIGCGIIAATQVIPANGGAEFYENCSGDVVVGTVVPCPAKVLVMNPAGAGGGTDVSTLAKEATLGSIETSADTLVTASATTNTTLNDILSGQGAQATAANQTTTNTTLNDILSGQGAQATAANQTTTNTTLNDILSGQGAQATAANQTTTNTTLNDILSGQGAQATATGQNNIIAAINAPHRAYAYDAALGNVAGVTPLTISGYGATDSTYGALVADLGAGVYFYTFPTVATAMTISSTSASDTALGSGAQTASITYIDFTTRAEVTVSVALNGTTPVGFTLNGFRENDASCLTFGGANGENVGDIYIGSGAVTGGIPAYRYGKIRQKGIKQAQAVYTVPAGKTLDLVSIAGFGVPTIMTHFQLRSRLTAQAKDTVALHFSQIGTFNLAGSISPLSFPAGTDIYFRTHTTTTSSAGITCQCYLR